MKKGFIVCLQQYLWQVPVSVYRWQKRKQKMVII